MLPQGTTLLLGIGAQKAGTTWLHETLARHPDCRMPAVKEVHYFDVMTVEGERSHYDRFAGRAIKTAQQMRSLRGPALGAAIERLRRHLELLEIYAGAPGDHARYLRFLARGHAGERVIGDITPSYALLSRATFAEMLGLGPDVRFVFVLRDPVDRLWSAIRMAADTGEGDAAAFAARAAERLRQVAGRRLAGRAHRSNYIATISELEAAVPADRILYLFYEELFRPESLARLADFLAIGPLAADFEARANSGRPLALAPEDARALYRPLAEVYAFCDRRFGAALPARWRERMASLGAEAGPVGGLA